MAMSRIKDEARKLLDEMPEDSTWDDFLYAFYVRKKVELGLADIEQGRTFSQEEVVEIMATITIPDEYMKAIGMTESELLVEFACRLFDAGKLSLTSAARMAGLDRVVMVDALMQRKIAIYRPTLEDFAHDIAVLDKMGI
jgi:predicted HTH domain antitoxin